MTALTLLWTGTYGEQKLELVAAEIATRLVKENSEFCLWLRGPLGAGKTTLTGYILRAFGLNPSTKVTSPTYTYMNDYRAAGAWYAHLDLYRSSGDLSPEEIGLADARAFRGIFVEWPEKGPLDNPYLKPTHTLDIAMAKDGCERTYSLESVVTSP